MNTLTPGDTVAQGDLVRLRHIHARDLEQICPYAFTVSITEPLTELPALVQAFAARGFWDRDAGAVAIEDVASGRLVGTIQFYRSAPCIHGLELGYIIHDAADRRRGAATEAVRLFSDHLFEARPEFYRLQLIIETWNVPSWKLAERCGFVREGLLRSAGFGTGDPADCFVYARTKKDWHAASHSPVILDGSGAAVPVRR